MIHELVEKTFMRAGLPNGRQTASWISNRFTEVNKV